MSENIKIVAWLASVWIFAWLAGSFATANLNIVEWSDATRGIVSIFASFACFMVIVVHKVK